MATKKAFPFVVVIGRFEPPHKGHMALFKKALEVGEQLIVVLGSHRSARSIKNPWTCAEREQMIWNHFQTEWGLGHRVQFVHMRDYLYNDGLWVADLQQKVREIVGQEKVALVGHFKDRTTTYLQWFPFKSEHLDYREYALDSTSIRHKFFSGDESWREDVPAAVAYIMAEFTAFPEFKVLQEDFQYVQRYRESWKDAPFPPTFVTVDAIILCSGHLLVVRRKAQPGKGTIAVPGGFINQFERIEDAMLRETKEETSIRVPREELRKHIIQSKVFDHPDRSLRGRTITHAYFIKLPDTGELPQVKGESDADKAWWMPVGDVILRGSEFFEDHPHMIEHFLMRV